MKTIDKILSKIFENPSRTYHIRELAREAKVHPNSVINAVQKLEKKGLLKRKAKKHIVEISANTDSPSFTNRKRVFNLSRIYDSGIIPFLAKQYLPKAIVLFGSYSRGEDFRKSDIDIAVISDEKKIVDVSVFEKKLKRKIHLLHVRYSNISEELYINLINGIVVYGYLDKK